MKPMSLRSRLLLVTIVVMAAGLVAANAATYLLLRSSLISRVDQQLHASQGIATRALIEAGYGLPGPPPVPAGGPSVTYTGLIDSSGRVVASRSFGFGSIDSPPALPDGLPGGARQQEIAEPRLFTVRSQDGALRYRVLATPLPLGQGTIVVAFPLSDVDATLRRLILVEGGVAALVLAAAAGVSLWLVRIGFRPLAQIEQTAAEIAAGNLSKRVEHEDQRTEVGRLGRALNVMLEKIEAAFAERQASEERLRRFVADASHELRTPLTSIRGYAELFRRGADARPEDLAKSMRRIEEESLRMGELVEELLLLARLDQGRPLDTGPVDLTDLAQDAVADARAVQPDRPIDIRHPGSVVVQGDEARLRQVMLNLLSNALIHTPPKTPVHVRVAADGDHAVVEVPMRDPACTAIRPTRCSTASSESIRHARGIEGTSVSASPSCRPSFKPMAARSRSTPSQEEVPVSSSRFPCGALKTRKGPPRVSASLPRRATGSRRTSPDRHRPALDGGLDVASAIREVLPAWRGEVVHRREFRPVVGGLLRHIKCSRQLLAARRAFDRRPGG